MHQIQKLATQETSPSSPTKSCHSPGSSPVLGSTSDSSCVLLPPMPRMEAPEVGEGDDLFAGGASHHLEEPCASSAHMYVF